MARSNGRAALVPPPTKEARPAENYRRDRVEVLGRLTGVRIAELGPRDQQPSRDPVHEARDRVDAEENAPGLDAGQPGGFGIVPGCIDMAAPSRLGEREPG